MCPLWHTPCTSTPLPASSLILRLLEYWLICLGEWPTRRNLLQSHTIVISSTSDTTDLEQRAVFHSTISVFDIE
jgi:hypothetical protein